MAVFSLSSSYGGGHRFTFLISSSLLSDRHPSGVKEELLLALLCRRSLVRKVSHLPPHQNGGGGKKTENFLLFSTSSQPKESFLLFLLVPFSKSAVREALFS